MLKHFEGLATLVGGKNRIFCLKKAYKKLHRSKRAILSSNLSQGIFFFTSFHLKKIFFLSILSSFHPLHFFFTFFPFPSIFFLFFLSTPSHISSFLPSIFFPTHFLLSTTLFFFPYCLSLPLFPLPFHTNDYLDPNLGVYPRGEV